MKIDNIDQALAAVRRYGLALKHLPQSQRTAEICLAAVRQDGYVLQYVPVPQRTAEVCRAAVQRYGHALKYGPVPLRTAEVCLAAIKEDDWALNYVPATRITVGMITGTGARDSRSVIDVYGDLVLTRELADKAVCSKGIDQWIDEHCAEDETITVADALATGDRLMYVCRVIAVAIRRESCRLNPHNLFSGFRLRAAFFGSKRRS